MRKGVKQCTASNHWVEIVLYLIVPVEIITNTQTEQCVRKCPVSALNTSTVM